MKEVKKLLKKLEGTFVYDIAKGQYDLLVSTKATKEQIERFEDDFRGVIAIYNSK